MEDSTQALPAKAPMVQIEVFRMAYLLFIPAVSITAVAGSRDKPKFHNAGNGFVKALGQS